ncbi:hypothetical protein PhCBS80983_g01991 [Powellomyces hirtus]|uniref:PHD-type domain-containing protein n=1 Tax=Powellomyces hirtus TaxID=109895 RepID=A0A507E881_9FUNG|nr:hypothetical protein PhCBS80983_g01991 [Powellomyces hirtus]
MSADPSLVRCVLCPARDGALEPVKDSDVWIHTICRQWIVSQRDNDRPITETDLQRLDAKSWQKLCSLCTSEERQTQGCKLLCNAAGCKNNMHPTCAADLGLLEKDTIHPEMSDPYFIYCKQHGSDDPRLNSWAKWVRNKQRILDQAAAKARTLASPEHLLDPRAVMTTYFAEFDEKQCEAITKMDHDIVQAGAEEAAYNRSITKLRQEIATLSRSREEEEKAHQAVESETEELQKRLLALFACLQRPSGLVDEIPQKNTIDLFFKAGANAGLKPEYEAAFLEAYARAQAHAEPLTIQIPAQNGRRGNSTMVGNSIMGGSSVGLCGICKTFEGNATLSNGTTPSPTSEVPPNRNNNNARRLVLCTTCLRSFHMGCLDPPLKSKPPRGYAWRCEGCDTSPEPSTASSASSPDKKRKRERWDDGSPTGTSDTAGSADSDSARPKRIRTMPSRYAF